MMHLRVFAPAQQSVHVQEILAAEPLVSSLAVFPAASRKPVGDVIEADVPREITTEVVERLQATDIEAAGTIHVTPIDSWVSAAAVKAERDAPGSPADVVVWNSALQRAKEDCELNGVYLAFLTLATLLAGIAIIVDSQILTIGAMVVGPEFGVIAAMGLALVCHKPTLFRRAVIVLVVGFAIAITITTLFTILGRVLGWVHVGNITGPRPDTAFIYSPDRWSVVIALIAAVAGVLSITSARTLGISGVFISVTTIPAAGNIAVALAFLEWHEIRGSLMQLGINIGCMALAGWVTLAIQRRVSHQLQAIRDRRNLSQAT